MNSPGIAAALLTVAAAGSVALVAHEWSQTPVAATPEHVCTAVADLRDALDLSSLGDQVALRARAAQLADLLASQGSQDTSSAVSRQLVQVLDDPGATVSDLSDAIAPIARQCPGLSPSR